MVYRNSPSGLLCISMQSTWHLLFTPLVTIGLTTTPFFILPFFTWQTSQQSTNACLDLFNSCNHSLEFLYLEYLYRRASVHPHKLPLWRQTDFQMLLISIWYQAWVIFQLLFHFFQLKEFQIVLQDRNLQGSFYILGV